MIDYAIFCRIHALHEEKGLHASQIAEELKLNPKTVKKWLAQSSFVARKSSKRSSKLDPFKGQIVAMLERHPYSTQQIFQHLQPQGYAGGYSILVAGLDIPWDFPTEERENPAHPLISV